MINSDIKKILIIKLRGIGDIVLSTIVLDNLKNHFPDAQIDFLTDKAGMSAIEGLPQINSVIEFPKKSIFRKFNLINKIFKNNYDIVFDFFTNPSTALITFLSGAKYRVGFPYRGRKYAYNLFGPSERGKYHAAVLHLKVLENLSIPVNNHKLHFFISDKDQKFADDFFLSKNLKGKFVIGISPSGGWKSKKCDPEKFAEFANALIIKYSCKILILWGPEDKEDALLINKLVEKSILAPPTTINQMGALIKNCTLLIANDSGPMHIATAVITPVLSLHGPTNPEHQGPFGKEHDYLILDSLDCIKCNLLICSKKHECFKNITIEMVLDKIDYLIKKNKLEI